MKRLIAYKRLICPLKPFRKKEKSVTAANNHLQISHPAVNSCHRDFHLRCAGILDLLLKTFKKKLSIGLNLFLFLAKIMGNPILASSMNECRLALSCYITSTIVALISVVIIIHSVLLIH